MIEEFGYDNDVAKLNTLALLPGIGTNSQTVMFLTSRWFTPANEIFTATLRPA